MYSQRAAWARVWLWACLAMAMAACAQKPAETQHYAGRIGDTDTFVGLATNGSQVLAYVCDGTEAGVSVAEWFRGTVEDGKFALTANDQAQLTGEVTASEAAGELVRADGSTVEFRAAVAKQPAGLYRLEETTNGETATTGWVKLETGEVRGAYILGGRLGPPPPGPGGVGGTGWPLLIYYFVYP
jgi:hypothetical protein